MGTSYTRKFDLFSNFDVWRYVNGGWIVILFYTQKLKICNNILYCIGSSVQKYLTIVLDILKNQLDPKKDTEVRLNLFTLLANVLQNYAQISDEEECHQGSFETFVTTIVQGKICPIFI